MGNSIQKTVDGIRQILPKGGVKTAIILGSGLGNFVETLHHSQAIDYQDLPAFPNLGVGGHAGKLYAGQIGHEGVLVLNGRAHYYETGDAATMKGAIFCLQRLGCQSLLLTNAAGSLNLEAGPGSLMMLTDHISFTGVSPLFNQKGNERFVDLKNAYDKDYQTRLRQIAQAKNIILHEGVYGWFAGPQFETPAEIRMAGIMGVSAIGMSTVPEVILARYCNMRVACLSAITNFACGISKTELSHEDTMKNALKASQNLSDLLHGFMA